MTDDLAADLVAKLMEDEEKQDKQWFYRDPQGQVQGEYLLNVLLTINICLYGINTNLLNQ